MKKLRVLIVNINIAPERCGSITMSPDVSNKISKYAASYAARNLIENVADTLRMLPVQKEVPQHG